MRAPRSSNTTRRSKPGSKPSFSRDRGPAGRDDAQGKRGAPRDRKRKEKANPNAIMAPRKMKWSKGVYVPTSFEPKPTLSPKARKQPKAKTPKAIEPSAAAPATAVSENSEKGERLQKILARVGVASSRRKAELLILQGKVTVNGKPAVELGIRVNPLTDKIKVDGNLLYTEVENIYLALYKPKGVISSLADPEGRKHIGDLIREVRERVVPIGRLDYNSEGLILLTNDGFLADKIQKARDLPKVYMVKIKGHPDPRDLEFLKTGIFTAEGVVRFASFGVEQSLKHKSWLRLEVVDGSKLDLRELLNHRRILVDRIIRTAIGGVSVDGLEPGEFRFLKRAEFAQLVGEDSKS